MLRTRRLVLHLHLRTYRTPREPLPGLIGRWRSEELEEGSCEFVTTNATTPSISTSPFLLMLYSRVVRRFGSGSKPQKLRTRFRRSNRTAGPASSSYLHSSPSLEWRNVLQHFKETDYTGTLDQGTLLKRATAVNSCFDPLRIAAPCPDSRAQVRQTRFKVTRSCGRRERQMVCTCRSRSRSGLGTR